MELMMNLTSSNSSTNATVPAFWQIGILEIWMLTFSFLTVFPTHCYIVWLISTVTGSALASEFFNLNLSVCDIVFSLNSLLILTTNWFPVKVLSAVTQFFFGFIVTGRPLFQCLICVERYLAVVFPIVFLKYKHLRYRLICCTVVWIYIIFTCLFCVLCFVWLMIYMYVWFYTMQFLLFLFIQLLCLVAVLRALKQSGPGDGKKEEENQMKRKAFNIIRVTTFCLVITYVPFIFTGLFSVLTAQSIQLLWSISYICFMLAGFVQPVLYLHRNGKLHLFSKNN